MAAAAGFRPGFDLLTPIEVRPDPPIHRCDAPSCGSIFGAHGYAAGGVTKHFCREHKPLGEEHLKGRKP